MVRSSLNVTNFWGAQARRLGGTLDAFAPHRSCERSGHAKRAQRLRALLVARRVLITSLVQHHCLAGSASAIAVQGRGQGGDLGAQSPSCQQLSI